MNNLVLQRPLVFFDLETTGTDPSSDRIVEIAVLRVEPDGSRRARTRRIHPERPIPAEATAIHGIGDEDVRDCPTFRQIARSLQDWLDGADLAGFNILRFDLPLLQREFHLCGLEFDLGRRRLLDAMTIFHRMEPRDLAAAVRFYLGKEHGEAHAAAADVSASAEVLDAQLARYPDLPRTVEELDGWLRGTSSDRVDRDGKFIWRDGEVVFAFGKHQGKSLREVVDAARDYLEWILQSDFPAEAKQIVSTALEGRFPDPPAPRGNGAAGGD